MYLIYGAGIVGHFIPFIFHYMVLITPLISILFAFLILLFIYQSNNQKLIIWLIFVYIFTFLIEIIGKNTGLVFGHYTYGKTLGLKVFDVPLIIGFNWIFIILGALSITGKLQNIFLNTLGTAILAVIFDIVLEPVAIKLDYWNWENSIIPLQNYIAWFVIASLSGISFYSFKVHLNTKFFSHYYIVQLILFILIRMTKIGH